MQNKIIKIFDLKLQNKKLLPPATVQHDVVGETVFVKEIDSRGVGVNNYGIIRANNGCVFSKLSKTKRL